MLPPASVPRPSGEPQAATIAARAAGRAREIVRVVGPPVDQIVRLDRSRKLWHIGLAENDGARGAKPRHRRCIGLGYVIRPAFGAPGADDARCFQRILDGHRHAVQRSFDLTARQRRIGLIRFLACGLRRDLNDGVELGIDLGDLFQMRLHDRFRAQLLGANGVGKRARRFHGDFVVHVGSGLRPVNQRCTPGRGDNAGRRSCAQKVSSSPFVVHTRLAFPTTLHVAQLIPFRFRMQVPGQHVCPG